MWQRPTLKVHCLPQVLLGVSTFLLMLVFDFFPLSLKAEPLSMQPKWIVRSPLVALSQLPTLVIAPKPALAADTPPPLVDHLSTTPWWQLAIQYQTTVARNQQYQGCLFGDSISSGLKNTLGSNTFNFALGGMSSVSLVEQLKQLTAVNVQCHTAIIAMGTNDAWYTIQDEVFRDNMNQAIALVRSMGAKQIYLIPAFYSTTAASYNPKVAGSIQRVEEINTLIAQVAAKQNLPIRAADIQPLFTNKSLKEALTTDGVHLNPAGLKIYQQALLKIFNLAP